MTYTAIGPNGVEWTEVINWKKHGKDQDEAFAHFLSCITWMDNW